VITFKTKKGEYQLPTCWGDLRYSQLTALKENSDDVNTLVAFLLECPHKVDATPALPFLSWLTTPVNVEDFEASSTLGDIKRMTWGKKVEAHMALQHNNTLAGIVDVVKHYTDEDCQQMRLAELIPLYLDIANQLVAILETEKATLSTEPTTQQIEAGMHLFDQLGYFNAIDDLAGGDPLKYDAVLDLEYSVVYSKLLKNKISATFAKNYERIVQRDAKLGKK
jgi:hypothetical protein